MSDKMNEAPESITKALSRKRAIDTAVRLHADGDAQGARDLLKDLGHEAPEEGLKGLLVELAGEACKAVARALLRERG